MDTIAGWWGRLVSIQSRSSYGGCPFSNRETLDLVVNTPASSSDLTIRRHP